MDDDETDDDDVTVEDDGEDEGDFDDEFDMDVEDEKESGDEYAEQPLRTGTGDKGRRFSGLVDRAYVRLNICNKIVSEQSDTRAASWRKNYLQPTPVSGKWLANALGYI